MKNGRIETLADKMRVHILAKELNVTSKAILAKCAAEGLSVKNHMSTLTAGQTATLREWFSEGAHETTVEVADRVNLDKVRAPRRRRRPKTAEAATATAEMPATTQVGVTEAGPPATSVQAPLEAEETPDEKGAPATALVADAPPTAVEVTAPPTADITPDTLVGAEPAGPPAGPSVTAPTEPAPDTTTEPATAARVAAEAPREGTEAPPPLLEAPAEAEEKEDVTLQPAGPQNVPQPARLRGPRVVRYEAPETNLYPPRRSGARRSELGSPAAAAETPTGEAPPGRGRGKAAGKRRGGRTHERRAGRGSDAGTDKIKEWRDRDLIERRERLAGATGRRIHTRRFELQQSHQPSAPPQKKTKAEIQEPFTLKDFCAAIGVPFLSVFNVLKRDHNVLANVNSSIDKETAELVALEFGVELTVAEARTSLDVLKEEFEKRERRGLQPRSPVVTMLGHVDHGKTSLLDAIRRTQVAEGEDGGITQHISSYHLMTPAGPLTFLDTPGHEAFTAMRARGAQLTDIVVLVVAADDGVMPQTVEAINHAKAAGVPIVVALNKIDLGDHKVVEIYGQLASHGLTPSGDWGGDTDVIRTSATGGQGIDELLEHLVAMGEVLEVQADPTIEAMGTAIEAETKAGVGPVVRLLVQEGTLTKGDTVVCGNAAGKVRALHNDRGELIESAGPSMPVEIWGLEDVPMAGDKLFQVDSMHRAKQIAQEVAHRRLEETRSESRKATSLEDLFKRRDAEETPELNVIVKADVDGSVDVLRHTLGEIPSDKVRLSIRHAAVGAVNDSDVILAEAATAIIIAFRVTTQMGARKLAEMRHVDIRYYRVVYEVVDEIVKAMEGKLAPEEKEEQRATAEVRQVFKIGKLGFVAGCMVTNGLVSRNHFCRVLREGIVVRDGCAIDSLRHFKDDAKEVRAGMECGIRLEGFDDLKPGDIIETYEIVKIARTLA